MLEGFTLNAFSGFVDAIRLAADRGGRSRQIHCGWEVTSPKPVTASCGLRIQPTSDLRDPKEFDYVAVCGGNDYQNRNHPEWLTAYLRDVAATETPLIGLCTGTFNIARAGLMEGYPACVHWNVIDEFVAEFPNIQVDANRIFLDAGKRITCAGSAGSTDLALYLLAIHCGHSYSRQAMRHLTLADGRPPETPQANFLDNMPQMRDPRLRTAISLMVECLDEPKSMTEIAYLSGLSVRQLDRLFRGELDTSPGAFQLGIRLRYGVSLLQHTTESVTRIAMAAGYSDAAHFGRHFRKVYGQTPLSLRRSLYPNFDSKTAK